MRQTGHHLNRPASPGPGSHGPGSPGQPPAPVARYTDWFEGEAAPAGPSRITNAELARRTIGLLKQAGEQFHQKVDQRLPQGHRMQKAVLAQLLQDVPHLGTCRIGRVPLFRDGQIYSIAEFYVTNFDAKLSTGSPHFYTYDEKALQKGGMFYGVGVYTDRFGRRLAFDRRFGDGGIYFQTKEEAVALYAMAGIATGRSLAELKQMDRNNFRSLKPPDPPVSPDFPAFARTTPSRTTESQP